jgi:hypothetical protein
MINLMDQESSEIALAFVEWAPDRETAEMCATAAVRRGATPSQLRTAWQRWERNQEEGPAAA